MKENPEVLGNGTGPVPVENKPADVVPMPTQQN